MSVQNWIRPLAPRDRDEGHRAATPLELLFDLCFVVAVALAAAELHHSVADDHVMDGLAGYVPVFFAIWWAWMNFTWFASAYDSDDAVYRVLTMVQIGGVLVLAAGVPSAAHDGEFAIATVGYVIMRMSAVVQWLRAARGHREGRQTALRYAAGITAVQVLWLGRLALPEEWGMAAFAMLVVAELAVPAWAERGYPTPWHAHHIAERYGLFTILLLGESVLAATIAVQTAVSEREATIELVIAAGGGLVLMFSLWWFYFQIPAAHGLRRSLATTFEWGYGHYFAFAALGAVGAGLAVATDGITDHAALSDVGCAFAVAVPVAIYLVATDLLHTRVRPDPSLGAHDAWVLGAALAVLLVAAATVTAPLWLTVVGMGLVVALLVAFELVVPEARTRAAVPAEA